LIKKRKLPIEIISIHDQAAESLAELDKKTESLEKRFWEGRDLPFPILLDKDNLTIKRYGVNSWPTTLLIDPEEKLVGRFFRLSDMEKNLPNISDEDYADLTLNSTPNWGFEGPVDLKESLPRFASAFGLEVAFDPSSKEALKTKVHFNSGPGTSMAGFLNSMLEPIGLAFQVRGRTLTIVKSDKALFQPSRARYAERRIREALSKKLDVGFDGELRNLIITSQDWTGNENIVPDPKSMMQAKIDLKAKVSFNGKGRPFGKALEETVQPLDLRVEIRNEAIYLVAKDVKRN
jgi:hypothetical protein